jgi:AcrR family transcriptional regulator
MARPLTRADFFAAAMDLLATEGFSGLKQATVCRALNVTTGSFYNHFPSWPAFKTALLSEWQEQRTVQLVELAQSEVDPIKRLDRLRQVTLLLPHRAESAIRAWSRTDADVARVQREVDTQRLSVVNGATRQLFVDADTALRYAHTGMYILVGFEQLEDGTDVSNLDWALSGFLQMLAERRDR